MKRFKGFILVLVFCNAYILFGQELVPMADASVFLKKLKETSLATETIKADFQEEKTLSFLKKPILSYGIFYYKKENKMRWEKSNPTQYIFLVSGDKIKIKENGKEKDVSSFNEAIGKIKDLMLVLVNGEFNDEKVFSPFYFQNDDNYCVRLVPKNKRLAEIIENIQLTFSRETLRLKELAFYEKAGDKSIMRFKNEVINENLEDGLFSDF